jgi:hypothetical protein
MVPAAFPEVFFNGIDKPFEAYSSYRTDHHAISAIVAPEEFH